MSFDYDAPRHDNEDEDAFRGLSSGGDGFDAPYADASASPHAVSKPAARPAPNPPAATPSAQSATAATGVSAVAAANLSNAKEESSGEDESGAKWTLDEQFLGGSHEAGAGTSEPEMSTPTQTTPAAPGADWTAKSIAGETHNHEAPRQSAGLGSPLGSLGTHLPASLRERAPQLLAGAETVIAALRPFPLIGSRAEKVGKLLAKVVGTSSAASAVLAPNGSGASVLGAVAAPEFRNGHDAAFVESHARSGASEGAGGNGSMKDTLPRRKIKTIAGVVGVVTVGYWMFGGSSSAPVPHRAPLSAPAAAPITAPGVPGNSNTGSSNAGVDERAPTLTSSDATAGFVAPIAMVGANGAPVASAPVAPAAAAAKASTSAVPVAAPSHAQPTASAAVNVAPPMFGGMTLSDSQAQQAQQAVQSLVAPGATPAPAVKSAPFPASAPAASVASAVTVPSVAPAAPSASALSAPADLTLAAPAAPVASTSAAKAATPSRPAAAHPIARQSAPRAHPTSPTTQASARTPHETASDQAAVGRLNSELNSELDKRLGSAQ